MSCMELGTAVKRKLNIVVVVMDNRKFGSIWQHQRNRFGERYFATDIEVPDFVKYAEAFGAKGIYVNERSELRKSFEEALSAETPVIIDVKSSHEY